MINDPSSRYGRLVDKVLPFAFPAIGREEARRAYARLVAHFGSPTYACETVRERNIFMRNNFDGHARTRRVWLSPGPTLGTDHFKGWGRLIHDFSHELTSYRHPSFRTHDPVHAKIEREVAEYVVSKRWLTPEGSLAPMRKPRKLLSDAERTEAAIERWESKLARAQRALKKLKTRQRAQERRRITRECLELARAQAEAAREASLPTNALHTLASIVEEVSK